VPAGAIEVGSGALFGLGLNDVPNETALGDGERGVEKGCAALVDVAAGGEPEGDCGAVEYARGMMRRDRVEGIRADAR
jgi:hypothetical protein